MYIYTYICLYIYMFVYMYACIQWRGDLLGAGVGRLAGAESGQGEHLLARCPCLPNRLSALACRTGYEPS